MPPTNVDLAAQVLRLGGLRQDMQLLDVASGSGAVSLAAPRLSTKVAAIDIRLQECARGRGLARLTNPITSVSAQMITGGWREPVLIGSLTFDRSFKFHPPKENVMRKVYSKASKSASIAQSPQHPQIPKHLQRIMAFRQRFEFLHRVLWLLQMRKERVPMNRLVNQAKAAAFEKRLVAVLNYRSRGPRL